MRKEKLLFKVDRNGKARVYINKKWLHDVTEINIHGVPWSYSVVVERFKRDSNGNLMVENNEIVRYISKYHI